MKVSRLKHLDVIRFKTSCGKVIEGIVDKSIQHTNRYVQVHYYCDNGVNTVKICNNPKFKYDVDVKSVLVVG